MIYTHSTNSKPQDIVIYTHSTNSKPQDIVIYTHSTNSKPHDIVIYTHSTNSKPQDIVIYTDGSVTSDWSGWGFMVKQGSRTVHEDSGAHRVTTSSLTMEVEAVTHAIQWLASQWDVQISHAIILTDSMNLLQKVKSGMGCHALTGIQPCTQSFATKTSVDLLPWAYQSQWE